MRIQILPSLLANQIAAGEVIERPASVVKELLENSLDADASAIEIHIEKGGSQLIAISDNGSGIHPDDLSLALTRHGTSKIRDFTDLETITSLGFRGEALASIAAVSRLALISCTAEQTSGFRIDTEGSNIPQTIKPQAHPVGTTIRVHDLFYNTPARRKFLRSEKTEFNYIEEMIKKIALSRFDLRIQLTHNDRKILNLNAAKTETAQLQRIAKIINDDFINHAIKIDFEAGDMRLWGWLSSAEFTTAQSNQQYFYLNSRVIRDKVIMHAINQAYDGLISNNRNPIFVLFLAVNPNQIDVNVHPMKHEVRFRETRLIHDFIFQAVHKALQPNSDATNKQTYFSKPSDFQPNQQSNPWDVYQYAKPETATITKIAEANSELFGVALAILENHFILSQNNQRLILIDVHAAEAFLLRLTLETQKNNLAAKPLLFPTTMMLNKEQASALNTILIFLHSIGFEIQAVGDKQFIIRQAPTIFANYDFSILLSQLCEQILKMKQLKKITAEEFQNLLITTAAKLKTFPDTLTLTDYLVTLEANIRNNHIAKPFWRELDVAECEKLMRQGH